MYLEICLAVCTILLIISKVSATWPTLARAMTSPPAKPKPGLPDQIYAAFDISMFGDRPARFLPQGSIDFLISNDNMDSISKIMGVQGGEETGSLMQYILGRARKVFAIAVHSGIHGEDLLTAMNMLEQHNISDESLPLTEERLQHLQHQELPPEIGCSDAVASSGREQIWTIARVGSFLDNQWKFLAPVFSLEKLNHELHQRLILPFTYKEEISQGAYGKVFKCKIHELHLTGRQHSVRLTQLRREH